MEKAIDKFLFDIGITDRLTIIKVKYGIEIVRTEFSKAIVFMIFFALFGKLPAFLFTLVVLAPLRCFTGGMHLQTKFGCFLFSFVILLSAIMLLPHLPIAPFIYYLILLYSSTIIFLLSPVFTKKRPVKTKERYLYLRKKSVLFSFLCTGLVVGVSLTGLSELFISGTWIITIQAIQLVIAKIINMKGGKTNEISS